MIVIPAPKLVAKRLDVAFFVSGRGLPKDGVPVWNGRRTAIQFCVLVKSKLRLFANDRRHARVSSTPSPAHPLVPMHVHMQMQMQMHPGVTRAGEGDQACSYAMQDFM